MKYNNEFFFLCFFLCGSCVMYRDYHDQQTLPRKPDLATGRLYAENIHGAVVYRTGEEVWIMRGLYAGVVGSLVVGALVEGRERRKAGRNAAQRGSDDRF